MLFRSHDIDDGVRSGLLSMDQLDEVPVVAENRASAQLEFPALAGRRLLFETIRRMLSDQVADVVAATSGLLDQHRPASAEAARQLPLMVQFSEPMARRSAELKRFLRANLYRHPQVIATTDRAKRVIADLFDAYRLDPAQMPAEHAQRAGLPRSVADYIAGMTDRFALSEHERITGCRLFA